MRFSLTLWINLCGVSRRPGADVHAMWTELCGVFRWRLEAINTSCLVVLFVATWSCLYPCSSSIRYVALWSMSRSFIPRSSARRDCLGKFLTIFWRWKDRTKWYALRKSRPSGCLTQVGAKSCKKVLYCGQTPTGLRRASSGCPRLRYRGA